MLTERKRTADRRIEEFKKQIGHGRRSHQPLSENEIQDRRQTQMKALLATVSPK